MPALGTLFFDLHALARAYKESTRGNYPGQSVEVEKQSSKRWHLGQVAILGGLGGGVAPPSGLAALAPLMPT
jgi:hypothetical protein